MAASTSKLNIPSSANIVQVSIIDSTAFISNIPTNSFLEPPVVPGYDALSCHAFSFLIQHPSGKNLLFDLGVRKDWHNFAPNLAERLKKSGWGIAVEKNVEEILESGNVSRNVINGIIWSHWHWDHIGDPSQFPSSTELIVGPKFKENLLPGYPDQEDSNIMASDYKGRVVREVDFEEKPLKIGHFNAYDFFNDGSFYLLDSPGHTVAHLCGLARTTTGPSTDTFILMGGDACHHGGEFRPSEFLPLPTEIVPHPFLRDCSKNRPCPGALLEKVHPRFSGKSGENKSDWRKAPFLRPAKKFTWDIKQCEEIIWKVQEADGMDNIFVVMAHDESLMELIEFFPKRANDWYQKGWGRDGKWTFLKDFQTGVERTVGNKFFEGL